MTAKQMREILTDRRQRRRKTLRKGNIEKEELKRKKGTVRGLLVLRMSKNFRNVIIVLRFSRRD